jgi:hypothetical protein
MWYEIFGLQQMVELLILDVQEDPQTSQGSFITSVVLVSLIRFSNGIVAGSSA